MRKILTKIPLPVITILLNARDSWKRTPLCLAAAWKNTNTDIVIQMVQFVIEKFEQPGALPFVFNMSYSHVSCSHFIVYFH